MNSNDNNNFTNEIPIISHDNATEFSCSGTLSSVEHAFDVLELFDGTSALLSLSDIEQLTGLHKSSVYRLVQVLAKRGYLEKDLSTKKYRLGVRIIGLASRRINDLDLVAEAHPLMLRLHSETTLTSQLCILDGTEVVYIDEVSSPENRRHTYMGFRDAAYCSSLGKCLLASLSGEELAWRFRDYRFIKYTENTITSFERLKSELKDVRKNGYALNNGERNAILSSIACPIYNYNGEVIAAISLGASSYLFVPETINNILPHLQRYSSMISKRLGYPIDITL